MLYASISICENHVSLFFGVQLHQWLLWCCSTRDVFLCCCCVPQLLFHIVSNFYSFIVLICKVQASYWVLWYLLQAIYWVLVIGFNYFMLYQSSLLLQFNCKGLFGPAVWSSAVWEVLLEKLSYAISPIASLCGRFKMLAKYVLQNVSTQF